MDEDIDFDDLLGEGKPGEWAQCPATNCSSYTERAADVEPEVSFLYHGPRRHASSYEVGQRS
jgi:hypothetical protein